MSTSILKTIQAINAIDIPRKLEDYCLDIDDEFPLHYSNGIVHVEDDGNPFSEWLKKIGYIFSEKQINWLAVWGT